MNKYYSADVDVRVHSTLALNEVEWDEIAALVIIFDKAFALEDLDECLQCVDKYSDSIEVKLAVGFNKHTREDLDADLDAHFIAHEVEYIDPLSSDQGGLRRVEDSLSTVMWDGMKSSGKNGVDGTSGSNLEASGSNSNPTNAFDDDFDDILNNPLNDDPDDLSHLLSKLNTISAKVRSIDDIEERHNTASKFADEMASYIRSDQDEEIN